MPIVQITEGRTFYSTEMMAVIVCCNCGIPFGVPDHWCNTRQKDQKTFYCPNGHGQSYTKSTEQILREQLAQKDRVIASRDAALQSAQSSEKFYRDQSEKNKRSAAQHAGISRRRKTQLDRVAKGVCPCCNRYFADNKMQQHMATKHPDFQK